MGAREKDLNPDIYIGLKLPMGQSNTGFFQQTKTTIEQTKYSITNLLKTIKGERVMLPTFGSTLHEVLFEQMDGDIEGKIEESINEAINEWLPFVTIGQIKFKHSHELDNQITVNIIFSLAFDPSTSAELNVDFETIEDALSVEQKPMELASWDV